MDRPFGAWSIHLNSPLVRGLARGRQPVLHCLYPEECRGPASGHQNSAAYRAFEIINATRAVYHLVLVLSSLVLFGARGGNRTPTPLPIRDFESRASASSATRA